MVATISLIVLGVISALILNNFIEWMAHKYILHGLGKKKKSYWRAHWNRHHKRSRKFNFSDEDYNRSFVTYTPLRSEVLGLAGLFILSCPLLFLLCTSLSAFAAAYVATTLLYVCGYYYVHRKSHLDVEWARKYLPWHYDHHMGLDQDKNWCVTFPLADHILSTRVTYEYDSNGKVLNPNRKNTQLR